MSTQPSKKIPLTLLCSSKFGRYPKISSERVYNMFQSDNWMVNFAGTSVFYNFASSGEGRGILHSTRHNAVIVVVESSVYKIRNNNVIEVIGEIDTVNGEISLAENNNNQVLIVDGLKAYIYNFDNNTLTPQALHTGADPLTTPTFSPQYCSYHHTYFLITPVTSDDNPQFWYAFKYQDPNTIVYDSTFEISDKVDSTRIVYPIPGHGNNVIVLGNTVGEIWSQVGGAENYRKITSFNIDNGIASIFTFAAGEQFVVWLAINEKNSPSIMICDGGSTKRISTDGIDFLLQSLEHPEDSTAMIYRQDGHLFYILTFFNSADNVSIVYDFNTDKFYYLTDEKLNYFPARQIVYFEGRQFFISLNDASLYDISTDYVYYNQDVADTESGDIIPRKIITAPTRDEEGAPFRISRIGFILEQGVNDYSILDAGETVTCEGLYVSSTGEYYVSEDENSYYISEDGFCYNSDIGPSIDISFSKDGNAEYSGRSRYALNAMSLFRNRLRWNNLGQCNEISFQFEFWGLQRFVVSNGYMEILL